MLLIDSIRNPIQEQNTRKRVELDRKHPLRRSTALAFLQESELLGNGNKITCEDAAYLSNSA